MPTFPPPGLLSPPASATDLATPNSEEDEYGEVFLAPAPVQVVRASSPTRSVVSLTSSAFASSFQYLPEYGRTFNTREDLYTLPADNEEIERLNTLHVALKLLRGVNYCGPVQHVLSENPDRRKAILDLGCGTGLWGRDMAAEFPHCDVVGIDLVPIQPRPFPPNFRVELDNFNLDMDHYRGQFDMVHGRLITIGVRNFRQLITTTYETLRPGGLALLCEFQVSVFDASCTIIDPFDPDVMKRSFVALFVHYIRSALETKGVNPNPSEHFEKWMEAAGFEDIHVDDMWVPLCQWYPNAETPEQERINQIGIRTKRNLFDCFKALFPLLIATGLAAPYVEHIARLARTDVENGEIGLGQKLCLKYRSVWATKGRAL